MNFQFNLIAATIIANMCRDGFSIYLPNEKSPDDAENRVKDDKLSMLTTNATSLIAQSEKHDTKENVIGDNSSNIISSILPTVSVTVNTSTIVLEASKINFYVEQNDVLKTESEEEIAARLGSSVESMKEQLFMQPSYHVIDIRKQDTFNAAALQRNSSNTRTTVLATQTPHSVAMPSYILQTAGDRRKITEAIDTKSSGILKKIDGKGNDTVHSHSTPTLVEVPKTTVEEIDINNLKQEDDDVEDEEPLSGITSNTTDCEDVSEAEDKLTDSAEKSSELSHHDHGAPEFVMETTKKIADLQVMGKTKMQTSDVINAKSNDITTLNSAQKNDESPNATKYMLTQRVETSSEAIIGQKEYILEEIHETHETNSVSVEENILPMTLKEARKLATNAIVALIRHDERKCGLEECDDNMQGRSLTKVMTNSTENQSGFDIGNKSYVKSSADSNGLDTPHGNAIEELKTEESDKKQQELSFLEKIILGIRCARQDCRDTLLLHASSEAGAVSLYKRRPISSNWTIMRMKRFRHQLLSNQNHSPLHDERNKRSANNKKAYAASHGRVNTGVAVDVALFNTLATCECRVTRLQRNFLRRMMFDDKGRAHVIDTLKNLLYRRQL